MKFILTKELGRLSRWLRILGFDTVYYDKDNLGTLLILALREDRKIITRSRSLIHPKRCMVIIDSDRLEEQLKEVIPKLNLKIEKEKFFSRCTVCNRELTDVEKGKIKQQVPPYVYQNQEHFMKCENCNKIYWKGTHWGNIKEAIGKII